MNSLTSKRFIQFSNKHSTHHVDDVEGNLDQVITNTASTNTKLDSVITNTASTIFSGVINFNIATLETLYSPVIDIGSNSKLFTFYWTGNKDSVYINFQIMVSSDNITFLPFTKAVFVQTPTKVETHYQMPFRYHKIEVFNNNAATAATNVFHYAGRI